MSSNNPPARDTGSAPQTMTAETRCPKCVHPASAHGITGRWEQDFRYPGYRCSIVCTLTEADVLRTELERLTSENARLTEQLAGADKTLNALADDEQKDFIAALRSGMIIPGLRAEIAGLRFEAERYWQEEREVVDALAPTGVRFLDPPDGGLVALGTQVRRLVEDWNALRARLASADADSVRLQREKEELTGVIETYGRVELSPREDRDILELRWQVAGLVFRAGGFDVFHAAIRECSAHWNAKLDAIRRADRPWQAVAADAFADALRAARPGAPDTGAGL